MVRKRWKLLDADPEQVAFLQQQLRIHPVLARLLVQRNILTFEEARQFFRPSLDQLHDPFLMADMKQAVARINKAKEQGERVLVFGDYDVDGTTAVALLYMFLRSVQVPCAYYVPHRYTEGYGLSKAGIDFAHRHGFSLIIALDCGIKAHEEAAYAASLGIDLIICDHHLPDEVLPIATAVLDPKRADCPYPYKELSGCGIGFKLATALTRTWKVPYQLVNTYLDLVAVSIAADIVPVTGENRVLAYHGLRKINSKPSVGLRALIERSGLRGEIHFSDLVFVLGPRINAAGRMEDARHAVELLIAQTNQASELASQLDDHNASRRAIDQQITSEALAMIAESKDLQNRNTTVLFKKDWHKGVIGIVASRLIDTWYRPTIMLTENNNLICGSARSIPGFDIYNAIYECRDLLDQFGGHTFAAGLMLRPENLKRFTDRFEEVVTAMMPPELKVPEIEIHAELDLKDITPSFYRILRQFAPFGPQNPKPVFMTRDVVNSGRSRVVGANHLKVSVRKGQGQLEGIAYGMADWLPYLEGGDPVSLCYSLEQKEWNGNKRIEMKVRSIELHHESRL